MAADGLATQLSQGISSNGIDLIFSEYSGLSARSMNRQSEIISLKTEGSSQGPSSVLCGSKPKIPFSCCLVCIANVQTQQTNSSDAVKPMTILDLFFIIKELYSASFLRAHST